MQVQRGRKRPEYSPNCTGSVRDAGKMQINSFLRMKEHIQVKFHEYKFQRFPTDWFPDTSLANVITAAQGNFKHVRLKSVIVFPGMSCSHPQMLSAENTTLLATDAQKRECLCGERTLFSVKSTHSTFRRFVSSHLSRIPATY